MLRRNDFSAGRHLGGIAKKRWYACLLCCGEPCHFLFPLLRTGCCVINDSIPAHSLVFGTSPNLVVKMLDEEGYWQISPFAKN